MTLGKGQTGNNPVLPEFACSATEAPQMQSCTQLSSFSGVWVEALALSLNTTLKPPGALGWALREVSLTIPVLFRENWTCSISEPIAVGHW